MKLTQNLAVGWVCFLLVQSIALAADPDLIGHWKLTSDAEDSSSHGHSSSSHGVDVSSEGGRFDGRSSHIKVTSAKTLQLGSRPFSIALWVNTEEKLDDVLGDLISKYDPASRTGFNLSIQNSCVTSAQANYRHLHFGIDAGTIDRQWTDAGRPGNNLLVFALCVFKGQLYAGTFEHGKEETGRLYRYDGEQRWVDCGSPDKSNTVSSLVVYEGNLYVGSHRYLSKGSALTESPNEVPGGRIYRYEGPGRFVDCGKLQNDETGESFTVGGMVVYQGELYAGVSKHPGKGLYRYARGQEWQYLGHPGHRVTNPVVYNGKMYFCSLDGGSVTRYEGDSKFVDVGHPPDVTQTYGFAVHRGELYVSSWPNGEVFRYDGDRSWIRSGRLGEEKEVMGMAVYNGKLYAGTLPLAHVYRYDGGADWFNTGQLDRTPDVKYRRAWTMAVYQGRLFCSTLPSGHVFSIEAGKSVTHDHALPSGWVHVTAVRDVDRLKLYVNGKLAAESGTFNATSYDIANDRPLLIGFGAQDYFNGKLKDVRLYRRALTTKEISELVK